MKTYRILMPIMFVTILGQILEAQVSDSLFDLAIKDIDVNSIIKEDIYKFKGQFLPTFDLTSLDGKRINSETLKGKPTVINFWFTECYPCIDEIPLLNELKNKFGEEVNFISITFNDADAVKSFLMKYLYTYIHICDAQSYIKKFGFFGYPKTLLLDKELRIVAIEKKLSQSAINDKKVSADVLQKLIEAINKLK